MIDPYALPACPPVNHIVDPSVPSAIPTGAKRNLMSDALRVIARAVPPVGLKVATRATRLVYDPDPCPAWNYASHRC